MTFLKQMRFALAAVSLLSIAAAHAEICKDTSEIEDAAKHAFSKGQPQPSAATYQSTSKSGKDKWLVYVFTNGACSHPVYLYTEAGKCEPISTPYVDEENSECS